MQSTEKVGVSALATAGWGRQLRRWWPLGLAAVALLVVLTLAIGGILRFQAPTSLAKTYFNDAFVSDNADGALATLCSGANTTDTGSIASSQTDNLAIFANGAPQLKGTVTFDISRLQYDLTGESVNTAQVHAHGPVRITTSVLGLGVDTNLDAQLQLNASGLGWCIAPGHITFALPLTNAP